ncbi:MAG: oxidoreductase [Propionibacteriaceae bacterium]|nr:oxidoreductase [Propionibacteriaceae bacterium]
MTTPDTHQSNNRPVALVTGASSGIGHEAVLILLELGIVVYAAARRVERMHDLEAAGAQLLQIDVCDDSALVAGVNQIVEEQGRIDILVNNAGYGSYGAIEDVPLIEARRQFEVNVFAAARLMQLVLPIMRGQSNGRIINITSMGGKFAMTPGGWYHATKYALEALSDAVRQEVSQFGIDVVIIEPGLIRTEWGKIAVDNLKATSGNGAYATLTNRFAKGLELQKDMAFVGSDPAVIGRAIARAATTCCPRVRYAIGAGAKPGVWLVKFIPARCLDFVIRNALGLPRRKRSRIFH